MDELTLLEESLPRVLVQQQAFADRFTSEVKQHHRWLGVVCFYSDSFPRSLRILSLATNIVVMLFVQSITYNLTKPDDGSCGTYTTQSTCLEPQSSLGTGESKCAWSDDHCSFVEHATCFTVVLFVAMISAILSTPIAYFQDYLIFEYLAAPIRSPTIRDDSIATDRRDKHLITDHKKFLDSDLNTSRTKLEELIVVMQRHRQSLSFRQRTEFDRKY